MLVGKGAFFSFLWTIQASTAFVARPRFTTVLELSSSRENYGWDASRYERYAPPQSYEESYYNQPPPPQQYYNDNYGPMENSYNHDNNYNPNNNYYYNSQPPPPPPQDSYQDTYNSNLYQDRGNAYDNRNLNNDGPSNVPLAPSQGYRNDRPEHYDNDLRRRNEVLPRPQYRSTFDLFDELWEDTNRIFGMMSPFRRTGSLLGMDSPFFSSSSSLLSPFFDSPFFGSSFSEMRSVLSSQQESIQPLLEQAEQYLNQDEACTRALGTDIRMGPVVSQSSASSSFNGEPTQSLTRLRVMVQGSLAEGSLWVSADAQGIAELILRTDRGEEIQVRIPGGSRAPMPPPPTRRRRSQRGDDPRDVVVDAEVVSEDENNNRANESPRGLPSAEARAFPNDWTKTI